MVFKHAKEGRSQRQFLSPLLTTTDKQPRAVQLGGLHPVSVQDRGRGQSLPVGAPWGPKGGGPACWAQMQPCQRGTMDK